MDSNHRSPARKSRFLLRKANCGTERGQPKRVVFLCGTDGSNPSPSRRESIANLTPADAERPGRSFCREGRGRGASHRENRHGLQWISLLSGAVLEMLQPDGHTSSARAKLPFPIFIDEQYRSPCKTGQQRRLGGAGGGALAAVLQDGGDRGGRGQSLVPCALDELFPRCEPPHTSRPIPDLFYRA